MLSVEGKRVHFIGIGGVGMSSLAQIAAARGALVDGCDISADGCIALLRRRGIKCVKGHSPDHLDGVDIVVYSAAVPRDCAELVHARRRDIPVFPRSHMLAHLMEEHRSICVVGSHGKTTTTSLVAWLLINAGMDPTVMLGGAASFMNGNFREGRSEWFVSEVDESDGLPAVTPYLTVLTNIDREHMDNYGTMENLKKSFHDFLHRTGRAVVVCADDECAMEVAAGVSVEKVTYGLSAGADVRAEDVRFSLEGSEFTVSGSFGRMRVCARLAGMHNVRNMLGAVSVGMVLGIPLESVAESVGSCEPVKRRLNVRRVGSVIVIDDYAHHPSEIRAVLSTVREAAEGRLVCFFQPHRYTRTADLMDEFAASFSHVDELYVLPIYAASERPIQGVDSSVLVQRMAGSVGKVHALERSEAAAEALQRAADADVLVFLGAGDIVEVANEVARKLALEGKPQPC